jgi:hypothetical protein
MCVSVIVDYINISRFEKYTENTIIYNYFKEKFIIHFKLKK